MYFILLGIVQGLTEFLPVSSSGHLVLLDKIFGVQTGNFLFVSIVLHIATLCSVCIIFWRDIWNLIKNPFSKRMLSFVVACIPTCIIVLIFNKFLISSFGGTYLPICFVITSIILMIAFFVCKGKNNKYKENSYTKSAIIGAVQGFAVLPGISRSGSTISTGIFLGMEPNESTSFSFILSIPIIFISLVYEIFSCVKNNQILFSGNIIYLIISFICAFLFGIFAIKFMKKIAKTGKYYIFSIYLAILAIVICFI